VDPVWKEPRGGIESPFPNLRIPGKGKGNKLCQSLIFWKTWQKDDKGKRRPFPLCFIREGRGLFLASCAGDRENCSYKPRKGYRLRGTKEKLVGSKEIPKYVLKLYVQCEGKKKVKRRCQAQPMRKRVEERGFSKITRKGKEGTFGKTRRRGKIRNIDNFILWLTKHRPQDHGVSGEKNWRPRLA